jgi:hypothetical protein
MKRIRQQEQAGHKQLVFGGQHRCLSASIGVPSEKNPAWNHLPYRLNRAPQPVAIVGGAARKGRPVGPLLAEWQIAAQDRNARAGKGAGKSN